MDSSSIVCMADTIIARGAAETPRLDTISYYDDSEPNWNERPYFAKVEEKRGRTGCHIDVSKRESLVSQSKCDRFAATPGSCNRLNKIERQYWECMVSQGNRVVLSGIGGDEVTGGVPTPAPELGDLLARGHLRTLAHQLKAWALVKKVPWFHLLFEALRGFFPSSLVGVPDYKRPASWLNSGFVSRNRMALHGYERRLKLFGPLPSFQENLNAINALRRQLLCSALLSDSLYEKRYPYLDRDLLQFMYSVPREQVVRPGHRRSLMRRAIVGIVPDELLSRKRKAFIARAPIIAITSEWANLIETSKHMATSSLGIVDSENFCEAVQKARHGAPVAIVPLVRTVNVEYWLRLLRNQTLLTEEAQTMSRGSAQRCAKKLIADRF